VQDRWPLERRLLGTPQQINAISLTNPEGELRHGHRDLRLERSRSSAPSE
jgi:hypothetical protein